MEGGNTTAEDRTTMIRATSVITGHMGSQAGRGYLQTARYMDSGAVLLVDLFDAARFYSGPRRVSGGVIDVQRCVYVQRKASGPPHYDESRACRGDS